MSDENQELNAAADDEIQDSLSDWPAPGQKLKAIREELGLSYAKVAESLHMTAHYVKALEEAQYDKLPGKTFVKGYFKAYAKFLGTDVDAIMTCYDQHVAALEESVESEENVRRAKKAYDQNLRWMICAAVIIIVVVAVSWWYSREESAAAGNGNGNGVANGIAQTQARSVNTNNNVSQPSEPVTAEILVASMAESKPESMTSSSNEPLIATVNEAVNEAVNEVTNEIEADSELSTSIEVAEAELMANDSDTTLPATTISQEDRSAENLLAQAGQNGDEVEQLAGITQQTEILPSVNTESALSTIADASDINRVGTPDYSVTRVDNHRKIELEIEGDDLLEIHFSGQSWIEVDNGERIRLYHDMLNTGDDLTIKGMAPFNILVGDASVVEMTFNSNQVDLLSRIRSDNSARLLLQRENR